MQTCDYCGQQIEFRYMGGQPIPIHVSGNWCPRNRSNNTPSQKPFSTPPSYINPNAYCPVCGEQVYFYQSRDGGRVFFDDVGWPWPKHGCTDKKAAQTGKVRIPFRTNRRGMYMHDNDGHRLDIYEFAKIEGVEGGWRIRFQHGYNRRVYRAFLPFREIARTKVAVPDFYEAPAFLITPYIGEDRVRRVYFICGRKQMIMTLEVTKA